jgi:predicted amidophosphoribosyltransferase
VCRGCLGGLSPAPGRPPPHAIDGWRALYRYDDAARGLLTSLKNGQRRDVVGWLADRLAAAPRPPPGAIVTWAPTAGARRRRRGFDQSELLARAVARRWGLPCRRLLRRRPGAAQAGRGGRDRRAHPGFDPVGRPPPVVVVVDDVATTGATLTAAGRALRGGGAVRVEAMVAARAQE